MAMFPGRDQPVLPFPQAKTKVYLLFLRRMPAISLDQDCMACLRIPDRRCLPMTAGIP